MTLKKIVPIVALLFVGALVSCNKDSTNNLPAGLPSSENSNLMFSDYSTDGILLHVQPLNAINLGLAENFAILSIAGIIAFDNSTVIGAVGSKPIIGGAILASAIRELGTVYSVDAADSFSFTETSPIQYIKAIGDMQTAYNDAVNRMNPCILELSNGDIGGLILTPGLYKWTKNLSIPMDIAIIGEPNDVWIFQIDGTLTLKAQVKIYLKEGAQVNNIFWIVAGNVTLEPDSHFEGNILGKTSITMQNGATLYGRILTQAEVTLHKNTVTIPK